MQGAYYPAGWMCRKNRKYVERHTALRSMDRVFTPDL